MYGACLEGLSCWLCGVYLAVCVYLRIWTH